MIAVRKEGILLEKTKLSFENKAVLNPAVIREGEKVHLFYRAVHEGNYSSVGYCLLNGPLTVAERRNTPVLVPEFAYESHGIEDPRIVKIDNLYYLTYTAFDGVNALGALAVSSDLRHFVKKGIIVPQVTYYEFNKLSTLKEDINNKYLRFNDNKGVLLNNERKVLIWDKNVIFFPRRINGKLLFLHRIKPDIQIVVSINELEELTNSFWQDYFIHLADYILLTPKYDFEVSYIGGGCPPVETEQGWLFIYHGVHDTVSGYVYSACAVLLDLHDPQKEIARLPYPLFKPEWDWEKRGEVNNVCFATGTALFGDTLYIYYGAADEQIATASVSISGLIKELMLYAKVDEN